MTVSLALVTITVLIIIAFAVSCFLIDGDDF